MRFGLSWRPEIGSGILRHLDEIEVVEILAEEFASADSAQKRALRFLGTQVPVVVHATSLGLASTEEVSRKRLDTVARVVDFVEPLFWSEHLAFVRAGGNEIGHLAAPPRNDETLAGLVRNVELSRRVVGSAPQLENVATLVDPPFSTYGEGEWLNAVTGATGSKLLLDLHNLHANASNFRFDARSVVRTISQVSIGAIHLAGGRRIEGDRILDDHLHAVPDEVYSLLGEVEADAVVILERDGKYPEFRVLLEELRKARAAARSTSMVTATVEHVPAARVACASPSEALPFLAKLYIDAAARMRFIDDPFDEARKAGFRDHEAEQLARIDPESLALAARSYEKKRKAKQA